MINLSDDDDDDDDDDSEKPKVVDQCSDGEDCSTVSGESSSDESISIEPCQAAHPLIKCNVIKYSFHF